MARFDWLRFPDVSVRALIAAASLDEAVSRETYNWNTDVIGEVEQDGRYAPYLGRQDAEIRDLAANERIAIPPAFEYQTVSGLSNEMVERLNAARPETLAAAGRVRGITPAALAAILVYAKRAAALDRAA
jgi:tRNA uridine 5-carboxymethylaminomethyl modification enzyme